VVGYFARRLLQMIPTLWVITLLLFFGMRAVPGGPAAAFAFNSHMSEAAKQAILHRWGLDQPAHVQYILWLKAMITGDWQTSFVYYRPVRDLIAQRLPATLLLMTTAYLLQEIIALPAGLLAALRRYSFFDQFVTMFSYVAYSMPTFWLGLMLLLIFGVTIPIFPGGGGIIDVRLAGDSFLTPGYNAWFASHPLTAIGDIAHHIALPAITIALVGIAGDSRFMRASMLDAIHQDFVRTARAKGLSERVVVLKHALRNALLPVVTNIALTLPFLFSGAIVTESVFSWPGMGQLFIQALDEFDYPVLMGVTFVAACLVLVFNFLADLAYAVIDPRISYA
jgi:peptide/nickel transport system permease protein